MGTMVNPNWQRGPYRPEPWDGQARADGGDGSGYYAPGTAPVWTAQGGGPQLVPAPRNAIDPATGMPVTTPTPAAPGTPAAGIDLSGVTSFLSGNIMGIPMWIPLAVLAYFLFFKKGR